MEKYSRGETLRARIWIRDIDNTLIDPATSITIDIRDAANSLKTDDQTMTRMSTGIYIYDYTIPVTATTGVWRIKYMGTSGSYVAIKRDRFAVVREEVLD